MYAWGMGNDNLSVELFRGDLQYMIFKYMYKGLKNIIQTHGLSCETI